MTAAALAQEEPLFPVHEQHLDENVRHYLATWALHRPSRLQLKPAAEEILSTLQHELPYAAAITPHEHNAEHIRSLEQGRAQLCNLIVAIAKPFADRVQAHFDEISLAVGAQLSLPQADNKPAICARFDAENGILRYGLVWPDGELPEIPPLALGMVLTCTPREYGFRQKKDVHGQWVHQHDNFFRWTDRALNELSNIPFFLYDVQPEEGVKEELARKHAFLMIRLRELQRQALEEELLLDLRASFIAAALAVPGGAPALATQAVSPGLPPVAAAVDQELRRMSEDRRFAPQYRAALENLAAEFREVYAPAASEAAGVLTAPQILPGILMAGPAPRPSEAMEAPEMTIPAYGVRYLPPATIAAIFAAHVEPALAAASIAMEQPSVAGAPAPFFAPAGVLAAPEISAALGSVTEPAPPAASAPPAFIPPGIAPAPGLISSGAAQAAAVQPQAITPPAAAQAAAVVPPAPAERMYVATSATEVAQAGPPALVSASAPAWTPTPAMEIQPAVYETPAPLMPVVPAPQPAAPSTPAAAAGPQFAGAERTLEIVGTEETPGPAPREITPEGARFTPVLDEEETRREARNEADRRRIETLYRRENEERLARERLELERDRGLRHEEPQRLVRTERAQPAPAGGAATSRREEEEAPAPQRERKPETRRAEAPARRPKGYAVAGEKAVSRPSATTRPVKMAKPATQALPALKEARAVPVPKAERDLWHLKRAAGPKAAPRPEGVTLAAAKPETGLAAASPLALRSPMPLRKQLAVSTAHVALLASLLAEEKEEFAPPPKTSDLNPQNPVPHLMKDQHKHEPHLPEPEPEV